MSGRFTAGRAGRARRHRPGRGWGALAGLLLAGPLLLGSGLGCAEDEPEPVQVARSFAEAVRYRNVEQILELVDAQTVARTEQAAERASDQVGGRRNIETEEMIQVVDVDARFQVASAQLRSDDGHEAVVVLVGSDGTEHSLSMVNEDGAWKVRLPLPRGPMGEP